MTEFPNSVQKIFRIFGDRVRLVGGPVRDLIIGKNPKDWDFCSPLLPEQILDVLEAASLKPFDLSNGHGTISVIIDGEAIEITTLRIDVDTDGRHATVEFTTDWKLDAERRDFTFNAMSMNAKGEVFDYFNGREHLLSGHVCFVGDADKRLQEDYLRILRYFRFLGRYSLPSHIYPYDQMMAISRNAEGLRQISGERVWSEMKKILELPSTQMLWIFNLMQVSGVSKIIGLEFEQLKKV